MSILRASGLLSSRALQYRCAKWRKCDRRIREPGRWRLQMLRVGAVLT